MPDRGHIVPIFATPFAAVGSSMGPEFNTRVAQLCESRCAAAGSPAQGSRDPLHFRSHDDLLDSTDVTAGELERLMIRQASSLIASLSGIEVAEFARLQVESRAWCSIVRRDGHVPCQHFSGASWLAVYCAQAGEPDAGSQGAGVLRLYERRLGSIYRDASTWELSAPYRYGNHTWTPVPGSMALFPAHVPHEVSVLRSDTALILVFALLRFLEAPARGAGA